jgi:uncharacterized membrane protein YgcG
VAFYTASNVYISAIVSSTSSAAWTALTATGIVPSSAAYFKIVCQQSTSGCYALFNYVWCSINDLRVPGSGQTIGDQRNLNTITWAGVRSMMSNAPIAYTITSGSPNSTVNFTVAATTFSSGGYTVPYNASSGSVSQVNGALVTYSLYYRDPTGAGGSRTLYITANAADLAAHPDIVYLGYASVQVAAGGGGASGGGAGGGGGGGGSNPPGYPIK